MATTAVRLISLTALVDALRAAGYAVIGPTVRAGSIVLAELESHPVSTRERPPIPPRRRRRERDAQPSLFDDVAERG